MQSTSSYAGTLLRGTVRTEKQGELGEDEPFRNDRRLVYEVTVHVTMGAFR